MKETHLPPLRHGQSTKPGGGEGVGVVVVGVVEVGLGESHISSVRLKSSFPCFCEAITLSIITSKLIMEWCTRNNYSK